MPGLAAGSPPRLAGRERLQAAPPAPPIQPSQSIQPVQPPSDREFRLFQELVLRETGIFLTEAKKALLVGRLARILRQLGLASWMDYFLLVEKNLAERVQMFDALCTHETSFFREPAQFAYLSERVFPQWREAAAERRRSRQIRVWSAGCSSGEEPYSIAMSLLDAFPREAGWGVEVIATDLSTRVLAKAEEGVWPIERASAIPTPLLKRFMLRGISRREGTMKAGPELRSAVRFARLNLNAPAYGVGAGFDLVFCRNVLIYFKPERRLEVAERLSRHLAPHGLLLLGHAESLVGASSQLASVGPMVYARHPAH
jgi:chemotaxis protein methyltransferase CheR